MLLPPNVIYQEANKLVKQYETRNTVQIAKEAGIYIHFRNDFENLLGMYTYWMDERHIFLNERMDDIILQMVCGHEIGHDVLHRDFSGAMHGMLELALFDMKTRTEYEANAFAAHLCIDDEELKDQLCMGYTVEQLSAIMGVNVNLLLVKLHELNRMGWNLKLPYLPHADFLSEIELETSQDEKFWE